MSLPTLESFLSDFRQKLKLLFTIMPIWHEKVPFEVTTVEYSKPTKSFLTFEANNNDNRDLDEFETACEKSLTTNEILIRFTSVDNFNTDQVRVV